jgi:hypothetical protein
MAKNVVLKFVLIIVILLLTSGALYYYIVMKPQNIKNIYDEFKKENMNWKQLNIENYSFKISNVRTGGAARLFNSILIIKNGNIDEEIMLPNKYYYESSKTQVWEPHLFEVREDFKEFSSINELYNYLGNYMEKYDGKIDFINGHCKKIFVEYDYEFHIPIKIEFDYWYNPLINRNHRFKYYAIDIEDFRKL